MIYKLSVLRFLLVRYLGIFNEAESDTKRGGRYAPKLARRPCITPSANPRAIISDDFG